MFSKWFFGSSIPTIVFLFALFIINIVHFSKQNSIFILCLNISVVFLIFFQSLQFFGQVGCSCRLHKLYLCKEVRLPQRVSWYDAKQSDGEAPVMLKNWGKWRQTDCKPRTASTSFVWHPFFCSSTGLIWRPQQKTIGGLNLNSLLKLLRCAWIWLLTATSA